MASSKKGTGTSRLEKGVNGRRSSKNKEGPLGEVFFFIFKFGLPTTLPLWLVPLIIPPPPNLYAVSSC